MLKKVRGLIPHAGPDYWLSDWLKSQMEVIFNVISVLEIVKAFRAGGPDGEAKLATSEGKERLERLLAMAKKLSTSMATTMRADVDARSKHEDKSKDQKLNPLNYGVYKIAASVLEDSTLVQVLTWQRDQYMKEINNHATEIIGLTKGMHKVDSQESWKHDLPADATIEHVISEGDKRFSEDCDANKIEKGCSELQQVLSGSV